MTGLLVAVMAYFALGYQRTEKKQILIIHSYEQGNGWMDHLQQGIYKCIKENKLSADIETIYLRDEVVDIRLETKYIQEKLDAYKDKAPDLIFVSGDEALLALMTSEHPFAYRIPVVFTGVAYLPEEASEKHPNMTGLMTTPDYETCYQLARQISGQVDEIILIAEDSDIGKQAVNTARQQLRNTPNLTEIYESYWSYSETDSLRSARSVVNPFKLRIERVDMLPGFMLKNVLYYKLNSLCILPLWHPSYAALPRMGTAPFLMVSSEGFGSGQIGGYMTPGDQQGYQAMRIAIDLLRGGRIEDHPITQSKQIPVFDWEQLHFWSIDLDRLPDESIIINMPILMKYKMQIIAASVIVSLFIALFALMLARLYRRESYNKNKAKENLKKERKELDITIESLNEGVVSISTDGIILSMNKTAVALFGFDPKQSYVGTPVWSLFNIQKKDNPSYLKELLVELSLTLGSRVLSKTAYIITKDKKAFSVAGSISSLYYNGMSYGTVLSFHDATDEYARKGYLALSMISGDLFACRYDQANRLILFDESFFSTFGLQDDGSHSISSEDFIRAIHPDDRRKSVFSFLKLMKGTDEKVTTQQRMDFTGKGYQWWEFRISVLPEATKESRYLLMGICLNIENFKQAEQELIRLKDEAENSDLLKSAFLANMSHEVRTPLNSIVGFSTLLIEGEELPKENRDEFMAIISENCKLLLKLINEILDLSRIESGIVFRQDPCDLTSIMEDLLHHYIPEEGRKENVRYLLDIPESPTVLLGDVFRLKQIMSNLLDNALKFTEEGSITWGYYADKEKEEVILFVRDTGVGIAQEYLPQIFDRFYKSDNFTQGGGLGLSIIYEIVKRLGGTIQVESELNAGTSFYVHLPMHEKQEEETIEKGEYETL
ncbi:ATP-binding protein [Parabacteroides sp. PF5-6]|uniref:sensor histidine kinase n=1 Tax=Parabacteroides sp. PF5-6 TaxID=1742403 RepID=UPI002406E030|nr:ATP-binding protein [Parabacteroides sp. PF5-6]